jgi:hypothetical protein
MSDSIIRLIRNDRVGGARNDDRQAGKGTAAPGMLGSETANAKRLWK